MEQPNYENVRANLRHSREIMPYLGDMVHLLLEDFVDRLLPSDMKKPSAFLARYGTSIMHFCWFNRQSKNTILNQQQCTDLYKLMMVIAPDILPADFAKEVILLCERT